MREVSLEYRDAHYRMIASLPAMEDAPKTIPSNKANSKCSKANYTQPKGLKHSGFA